MTLVSSCSSYDSLMYSAYDWIGTWNATLRNGEEIEIDQTNSFSFQTDGRATFSRWGTNANGDAIWKENIFNYKCRNSEVIMDNAHMRFLLHVTQLTETTLQCLITTYFSQWDEDLPDDSVYTYTKAIQ